jgi:hypothetical protein
MAIGALATLVCFAAQGAAILWNVPVTIAADADVITNGSAVFACDWNKSVQTVNSVVFTAPGVGVTVTGLAGNYAAFVNGTAAPATSLSTAYMSILTAAQYDASGTPPAAGTVALNNLMIGHQYAVQFWANDSRIYGASRHQTVTSSGGNTVTLAFNTGGAVGGLGQYTVGTFTADAPVQVFTAQGNTATQVHALQLRDITPPGTNAASVERITNLVAASGTQQVSLTWTSFSNTLYALEQTSALVPPAWHPQLTNILSQGTNTTASLPQAATNTHSFYRVARDVTGTRYYNALESAAVQQSTLASLTDNSLLLGNGDVNALLYAGTTGLKLRLTKNDVWDARIDTSSDPALAVINIPAHTISGGSSSPPSWNPAYPCPLTCAVLDLTSSAASGWQQIRAEGTVNTWVYTNGLAVMSIQGSAGASCGWQGAANTGSVYTNVHVRLSGTANARYFVEVITSSGQYVGGSGWQNTPASEQDAYFALPANTVVSQLILYAWTTDGALAQNRYSFVELRGPSGNYIFDLSRVTPEPTANRLDLRRAVATVPGNIATNPVSVRALADRNVFLIEGDTTVMLQPTTASFVPAATRGTNGAVEYLIQTLPADLGYPTNGDWPGMSFVVAKAAQGQRAAVAIVTSVESSNALNDAVTLASSTLAADANALRRAHEDVWAQFWSASRLDLADTYLRDVWYRNLYFMRCVSKAGVKPVGLFAGLVSDSAAWHGDFHLNYNAEQTYWGWYRCNHGELSEPYEWLIRADLSRAQWLANVTYGCSGAFFAHSVFLYEPPVPATCKSKNGRQIAFIPYTYTLGDSGWAVQNLWLHYKHYPDSSLLQTNIYPAIKQVALFYADFTDRCRTNTSTGKIVFGPTYSPEHWDWGKDDGTCDIAFARLALKAAIESANLLGVDTALVSRWQGTLERLPNYPRTTTASPVILDVAGVSPTTYNVPVPALPVYPAGDITWFSSAADRQIFSNTIAGLASNGNNDLIILAGARARLSMPDAWSWTRGQFLARQRPNGTLAINVLGSGFNSYGHYTEDFAAAGVITEMLLQSANDILRVFPAWPADLDGAFENLRAQGGFLVSAEQAGGQVTSFRVASTAGGTLRFLNPWSAAPQARKSGMVVSLAAEGGGVYSLGTAPGERVELTPGQ